MGERDDMTNDPEYEAWIESLIEHCQCCEYCHQEIPCAGVQAGGMCDNACNCTDDEDSRIQAFVEE